jgi:hypothetical protein
VMRGPSGIAVRPTFGPRRETIRCQRAGTATRPVVVPHEPQHAPARRSPSARTARHRGRAG